MLLLLIFVVLAYAYFSPTAIRWMFIAGCALFIAYATGVLT